jgi:hypothetical protein
VWTTAEKLMNGLSSCLPLEGLARPAVERGSDGVEVIGTVLGGRYWRNRPLVFSLVPRSHGDDGSQKRNCLTDGD